ncbi:hypothetical protein IWX49DRAFT_553746 [Phyllosticta citricarpa]
MSQVSQVSERLATRRASCDWNRRTVNYHRGHMKRAVTPVGTCCVVSSEITLWTEKLITYTSSGEPLNIPSSVHSASSFSSEHGSSSLYGRSTPSQSGSYFLSRYGSRTLYSGSSLGGSSGPSSLTSALTTYSLATQQQRSPLNQVPESNYGSQISRRAAGLLGFHQVGDVVTIQLAASNDSTIFGIVVGHNAEDVRCLLIRKPVLDTHLRSHDVARLYSWPEPSLDGLQIRSSRNTPITAEPSLPYSNNRPEAFPVPAFVDYNTTFNISNLTSLAGIAKVAQVGFPALGTVMSDWKRVIREKLEEVNRSLISSRRPDSLSDSTEMPSELKVLLIRGDLYAAERYLDRFPWRDRHTDMINDAWIQELLEMGHSKSNVAELLMGQVNDSPWIYLDLPPVEYSVIKEDWHNPGCPHHETTFESTKTTSEEKGGFPNENRHVKVSYNAEWELESISPGFFPEQESSQVIGLGRMAETVDDLFRAASCLQDQKVCCDSFSILVRPFDTNHAELTRVSFKYIIQIRSALLGSDDSVFNGRPSTFDPCLICERNNQSHMCDSRRPCLRCRVFKLPCEEGERLGDQEPTRLPIDWRILSVTRANIVQNVGSIARKLLSEFKIHPGSFPVNIVGPNEEEEDYIMACLATQLLSTGLLSYLQAHVSPLKPSFLYCDIEQISLMGAHQTETSPMITARPFTLTCMDEMLQRNVPVFEFKPRNSGRYPGHIWGPGCYLTRSPEKVKSSAENDVFMQDAILGTEEADPLQDDNSPGTTSLHDSKSPMRDIYGIRIGGGTIMASTEQSNLYHFYPTASSIYGENSLRPFRQDQRIMIGAFYTIHHACTNDERARYRECDRYPSTLGGHPSSWESTQRQLGLQGGQYVVGQYAHVWNKIPGTTIKKYQLSKPSPFTVPFLEAFWGLQVSFCTRVARRVRMRKLLADVILAYISIRLTLPVEWSGLKQAGVIEVLRGEDDLQERFGRRSGQDTGNLSVAWPVPKKEFRSLRIPRTKESSWAKILADSEDCATFAYITSECLEAEEIQCHGLHTAWQNKTSVLCTAVSPHQSSIGEEDAALDRALQFKDGDRYYIGDPEQYHQLRVDYVWGWNTCKLRFHPSKIGVPIWRRLTQRHLHRRIREKQDDESPARAVLVLTAER